MDPRPHVVAIPFTGQGHITPMLQLCRKLVASGCVVTFVNTQFNQARILSAVSRESLEEMGIFLETISDGLPEGLDRDAAGPQLFRAVTEMAMAVEEVIVKVMQGERGPVTCILSDVSMLCTQDVANKLAIPRAALWTQTAASYASHLALTKAFPDMVKFPDLSDLLRFLSSRDKFLSDFCLDPFRRIEEASYVLLNTFQELESEELVELEKVKELHNVGPLLPLSFFTASLQREEAAMTFWSAEDRCLQWLDGHGAASVLYVSLGSVTVWPKSQVQEFAAGLEASQVPFLWVIRPNSLVTDSEAVLQDFKERVAAKGMVISWAPQLQVLAHPSIAGFLTHCGWNSVLESISAGVPMIGKPGFGDQKLNCRYMVEVWRVGVEVEADLEGMIRKEEVERKVRCLMIGREGKEARLRALGLKQTAKQAVEEGGSSHTDFQRFITSLKARAHEQYSKSQGTITC